MILLEPQSGIKIPPVELNIEIRKCGVRFQCPVIEVGP
jgi:hypothetical protein